jgi:hypothetical protein
MWFIKVFRGGGGMECVRRAVAVEVESPMPELYAVEEQYRRIVEEVAAYVAERGRLEGERYNELYRRFRKQYHLPAQLMQQAMNQGVETGESFLELKRNGRVHKPRPEVGRVSIRFAKDSWSYIIHAVWVSLMALKAGGKWPAVLARAAPMTPAQGADEDGARAPPRPKGTPAL